VLTRVFAISGNPKERRTNERLWQLASKVVAAAANEQSGCSHLNQALMELGAVVCLPQMPKCGSCPLRKCCVALADGRVDRLPNLPARMRATQRRFLAFVVNRNDHFLVRQRPDGIVNQRLWEFPNVEVTNGEAAHPKTIAEKLLGLRLASLENVGVIRHSITRYRISVDVFRGAVQRKSKAGQWLTLEEVDQRALTSAHRKILAKIWDGSD
jgi:A/G-specific adenine glycosylase